MMVLLTCSIQALSGQRPFGSGLLLHQFETEQAGEGDSEDLVRSVMGLVGTLEYGEAQGECF